MPLFVRLRQPRAFGITLLHWWYATLSWIRYLITTTFVAGRSSCYHTNQGGRSEIHETSRHPGSCIDILSHRNHSFVWSVSDHYRTKSRIKTSRLSVLVERVELQSPHRRLNQLDGADVCAFVCSINHYHWERSRVWASERAGGVS